MEVIGAASSIIQIIIAFLEVGKEVKNLSKTFRHAAKELKQLYFDVHGFSLLVRVFDRLTEEVNREAFTPHVDTVKLRNVLSSRGKEVRLELTDFIKPLRRFKDTRQPGKVTNLRVKWYWYWNKEDYILLRTSLGGLLSMMNFLLLSLELDMSLKELRDVRNDPVQVAQMTERIRVLEDSLKAARRISQQRERECRIYQHFINGRDERSVHQTNFVRTIFELARRELDEAEPLTGSRASSTAGSRRSHQGSGNYGRELAQVSIEESTGLAEGPDDGPFSNTREVRLPPSSSPSLRSVATSVSSVPATVRYSQPYGPFRPYHEVPQESDVQGRSVHWEDDNSVASDEDGHEEAEQSSPYVPLPPMPLAKRSRPRPPSPGSEH